MRVYLKFFECPIFINIYFFSRIMYNLNPLFIERIKKLSEDDKDFNNFILSIEKKSLTSIRCNTIKISPEELRKKLEKKGWKISQPYSLYPEIMIIESNLAPGELGNSIENRNGEFYIQDLSSMMPCIILSPSEKDVILDLCASPGSKTTYLSMMMKNKGTIIANDYDLERIYVLNSNLYRCSCTNTIVTRNDAIQLCKNLLKIDAKFDKILLDVPCSGEGIIKNDKEKIEKWNIQEINKLSNIQKKIIASAIPLLKNNGSLVYSTCTYAPEENEEVIDFALKNFPIEIEKINIPLFSREGITTWYGKKYDERVRLCKRIYPQDNKSDGFFIAKLKRM